MMTPPGNTPGDSTRMGMVYVSDGKSRPRPARLKLTIDSLIIQEEIVVTETPKDKNVPHTRERMVQITRQKVGGLGLSIKGGSEHKLPILISKIFKDQAADLSGQLFVGDAVIKVNGEYITACKHDDAVTILRNAGDIVVLTVRHYRAAMPFLMKQDTSDTDSCVGESRPSSAASAATDEHDEETNSNREYTNGWQSRPDSAASFGSGVTTVKKQWKDTITVPLMMGYVTRYIHGTDKLRPNAFEVVGARGHLSSGVIHVENPGDLSRWLKAISDNIQGLTTLQMKLLNRSTTERITFMGWIAEGTQTRTNIHTYTPKYLVLQGTDLVLLDQPPLSVVELNVRDRSPVLRCLLRTLRPSQTMDWRPHAILLRSQLDSHEPKYCCLDTRHELLRLEACFTTALVAAVLKAQSESFSVVENGKLSKLVIDWNIGFTLNQNDTALWSFRFSQLRGSSDDSKSKLKLHFQDPDTKLIETKELECQALQNLLYCMHAFLTAKVASVDPAFLASIQQHSINTENGTE